ncbi:hypothetical protein MWU38_01115 [Qipengyuania sp. S6317L1]|nr:hypothetical protein [Qipengyuania sp. S6317L1]
MRVLFYLPVITPWWFENIIVPLLEKLAADNEIHILAPIVWKGTGVGQCQYDLCAHMPQIHWHIVTDHDHVSMRTKATQAGAIIDFVKGLAPDFVLCRSADLETVRQFPGIVRHITEGGAEPLSFPVDAVHFTKEPFAHGIIPDLDDAHFRRLNSLVEPYWQPLVDACPAKGAARNAIRQWAKLPFDRPILFLPLEYEHEENFFTIHRKGALPNVRWVEELLDALDPRVFVAMTNHPLNELYVDNSAIEMLAATHPERLSLLPAQMPSGARTTPSLMRAADGVYLGDSKAFSLAAFCGTPIVRRSKFESANWLGASENLEGFAADLIKGCALAPSDASARTWFACHAANNLVWPKDPELTGADILERLSKPFNPERWERNLGVYAADWMRGEQVAT